MCCKPWSRTLPSWRRVLSRKRKRYSLKILSWRGYNASRELGDLFGPLNGCQRGDFIVWECNWGSAIGEVPSCCKHLQFEKCGKTPTVIKPMFDQTGFGHTREISMGVLGPPYLHWPCNFGKSFLKLFLDFEGYFCIIWLLKIGQVWTSASMSVQFRLELNLGPNGLQLLWNYEKPLWKLLLSIKEAFTMIWPS